MFILRSAYLVSKSEKKFQSKNFSVVKDRVPSDLVQKSKAAHDWQDFSKFSASHDMLAVEILHFPRWEKTLTAVVQCFFQFTCVSYYFHFALASLITTAVYIMFY